MLNKKRSEIWIIEIDTVVIQKIGNMTAKIIM